MTLPIFTIDVKCWENRWVAVWVDTFVHAWDRARPPHRQCVQLIVIDAQMEISVFLLNNKQSRWCPIGPGKFDNVHEKYLVYIQGLEFFSF